MFGFRREAVDALRWRFRWSFAAFRVAWRGFLFFFTAVQVGGGHHQHSIKTALAQASRTWISAAHSRRPAPPTVALHRAGWASIKVSFSTFSRSCWIYARVGGHLKASDRRRSASGRGKRGGRGRTTTCHAEGRGFEPRQPRRTSEYRLQKRETRRSVILAQSQGDLLRVVSSCSGSGEGIGASIPPFSHVSPSNVATFH